MKNGKFTCEKTPQILLFDLIFLTLSLLENVFIVLLIFLSSSLKISPWRRGNDFTKSGSVINLPMMLLIYHSVSFAKNKNSVTFIMT